MHCENKRSQWCVHWTTRQARLAIPNKIDPHLCNPENHVETTERQICFVKEKIMNGMTKIDSFCYPWMGRVTEAYSSG